MELHVLAGCRGADAAAETGRTGGKHELAYAGHGFYALAELFPVEFLFLVRELFPAIFLHGFRDEPLEYVFVAAGKPFLVEFSPGVVAAEEESECLYMEGGVVHEGSIHVKDKSFKHCRPF